MNTGIKLTASKFTQEYTNRMRACAVFLKGNGGDEVALECADEIDRLLNALDAETARLSLIIDGLSDQLMLVGGPILRRSAQAQEQGHE